MCGIAGGFFFTTRTENLDVSLLKHRGPDSSGTWRSPSERVWLGHTRLAIVDLSPSGAQPMVDPVTGNCIVFNGEIYNNPELRRELLLNGVSFQGTSDTETLLLGYRFWGESILDRLRGMFAFAIYDQNHDAVFLARDRFGIKPLYTCHRASDQFFFASEVRWLRANIPDLLPPTKETVSAYLQVGASPHQMILYPEVRDFPAASSQWIRRTGPESPRRYWFLESTRSPNRSTIFGDFSTARPSTAPTFSKAAAEVRRLLESSMQEHLISDVPVSCLLSGGIDSSVITALASRALSTRINTFSVGFKEREFDESRFAQMVADRYGTRHHHIRLSEDEVLECVHDAVNAMDLPTVDGINTMIVVRQVAKAGYKVVLSGLGGDEIFGGYPQFRQLGRLQYLAYAPRLLTELLIKLGKARHFLRDVPKSADTALFDLWWRRIWGGYLLQQCALPVPPLRLEQVPPGLDDFGRISWAEIAYYMRDTLLRDADQMSMAVSLEMRVPFLDHRIVEYVLKLPAHLKISENESKCLLLESCRDLLPPEVYQRPKMGFELPMDKWMRGPLRTFVENGLSQLSSGEVRLTRISKLLLEQFDKRVVHWSKVWSAVVLGAYMARAKDRASSQIQTN